MGKRKNPDHRGGIHLPLPEYVEAELEVGHDAIGLLQDILRAVSDDDGLESPWLPEHLRERILVVLLARDRVDRMLIQ